MIALLQRVSQASISIESKDVTKIQNGLAIYIGVQKEDTEIVADLLVKKMTQYRVFPDKQNKINLSVLDVKGEILLIPQVTLAIDTSKGLRPSFSDAAKPEHGNTLFDYVVKNTKKLGIKVESGIFGADMRIMLVNEGPITFWLECS
ncbi:MAG: D-aminoacyl-tRNA deacylase [Pseudomonadota bacterium]